jgi:hypothetical protein
MHQLAHDSHDFMTPAQAAAIADQIEGWMYPDELLWIAQTAATCQRWLEIGVHRGRSLTAAALVCPEVYGVDPEMPAHIEADATFLRLPSLAAVTRFPDGYFDAVFIDGDHSYEGVKADIAAWRPKTKGLLCGHDYGKSDLPGVTQAVDEAFGVPERGSGSIWFVRV